MAPKRTREDDDSNPNSIIPKKPRKGFRVGPDNLPDGAWRRRNTRIKQELIQKAKIKKEFRKYKAKTAREAEESSAAATNSPGIASAKPTGLHPDRQLLVDQATDNGNVNPERQALLNKGLEASLRSRSDITIPPQEEEEEQEKKKTRIAQEEQRSQEKPQPTAEPTSALEPPPTNASNRAAYDDETTPHDKPHRDRKQRQRRPGYYDKALEDGQRKKAEAEAREAERKRREEERERKQAERERMRKAMLKARGIKPGGGQQRFQKEGKRKLGRESHVLLDKVRRLVGEKA